MGGGGAACTASTKTAAFYFGCREKRHKGGQEAAATRCSRCVCLSQPFCHEEGGEAFLSGLSGSFHFACNEVNAGGQLLTPAESFSPLMVSFQHTLLKPPLSPSSLGCHRAPKLTLAPSLIFKLEEARPNNGCGAFLRI